MSNYPFIDVDNSNPVLEQREKIVRHSSRSKVNKRDYKSLIHRKQGSLSKGRSAEFEGKYR